MAKIDVGSNIVVVDASVVVDTMSVVVGSMGVVGEIVVDFNVIFVVVLVLGKILQFFAIVVYSYSVNDWFLATSRKISYMLSIKKGGQGADSKDGKFMFWER